MEQNFELKSLKLDIFGLDCKYKLTEVDEKDVETTHDNHVKDSRPIHQDLVRLFSEDLTKIVVCVLGYASDFDAINFDTSFIKPQGISFAGKDDNIGIVISGTRRTNYGDAKFKTPRIKFKAGSTSVDAALTVFADAVVNEAYAYLFDGKVAELKFFGE